MLWQNQAQLAWIVKPTMACITNTNKYQLGYSASTNFRGRGETGDSTVSLEKLSVSGDIIIFFFLNHIINRASATLTHWPGSDTNLIHIHMNINHPHVPTKSTGPHKYQPQQKWYCMIILYFIHKESASTWVVSTQKKGCWVIIQKCFWKQRELNCI